MKRFKSTTILFVLMVLVLTVGTGNALAHPEKSAIRLKATTYLQMPATTWGGATTSADLIVDRVQSHGTAIGIEGSVTYDGRSCPIDLSGTAFDSGLGGSRNKVAELTDSTGDFTVLQFALRQDPNDDFSALGKHVEGPGLYLYLLRNGTREATLIEVPIVRSGLREALLPLLSLELPQATFTLDYWSQRLFQPFDGTSGGGVTPYAVQDAIVGEYNEFYSLVNGCWVEYRIRYLAYANGPSDIARDDGQFNHMLELPTENKYYDDYGRMGKFTDSNCSLYQSSDSPYQIGEYSDPVNVKIKTFGNGTDSGDVLLYGRYTGNYTRKSSYGQVSLSLGIDTEIASVTWSKTLCCQTGVDDYSEVIYSQGDPNDWTKLASYAYTDRELKNEGEHFDAYVQNAWGVGARADNKTIEARWTIPIYQYDINGTHYKTTQTKYTFLFYTSG